MISTLLWAGTDLRNIAGVHVGDLATALYAPMTRRGNDEVIPGRDGALGAPLPFDSYQFTVPVLVVGNTEADLHGALLGLGAVLRTTGGLGLLTRRLVSNDPGGLTDYTAQGRFAGLSGFTRDDTGRQLAADLLFTNLSGGWQRADGVWVWP